MSIYKMRTEMGHYFKWILLLVLVPIFVIGGASYFGPQLPGRDEGSGDIKEVIAKVNGLEITRGEFETSWETYSSNASVRSPLQFAEMRGYLLQDLVQKKLMLVLADAEGIDVSDSNVDAQVEKAVTAFLKNDRKSVRGTLTKAEEAVNPRDDQEYKNELASMSPPQSVSDREKIAMQMISRDAVSAQVAQEGLTKKIKDSIKPVTDADINASYNVYKLTQIALIGGAKEQLKAKADKILAETKTNPDFAAIAKVANAGGPFAKAGSQVVYSFDTRSVAPAVSEAAEKMKPGEISPAIDLGSAYIIFKLDAVVPKVPANMDKKAKDARRKQLEGARQQTAFMAVQQKMMKMRKVEMIDPEMRGYWLLSEAQQATSATKYTQIRASAEKAFKDALIKKQNNIYATSKLASLYVEDNKLKEAEILLNGLLNGEQSSESADMRKMFGDVLVKLGKKDEAIKNYDIAGRMSKNDPVIMDQLLDVYKKLGRADLVAAMNAQKADYATRKAALEAMQKKQSAPAPAPTTKPAPKK